MDTITAPAMMQGLQEPNEHAVPPCVFVSFGATGDLTRRKIAPALFSLFTQNLLPKSFAIVAFARRDMNDDTYREEVKKAIKQFAPKLPVDGPEWDRFARIIFYLRSNLDDVE